MIFVTAHFYSLGLAATCARIWGTSTGLRPIGSILLYLPTNVSSQYLRELASFLDLKQINNLANVKRILLDLIFTSISSGNVSNATDELLPVDIHNPAFLFCCTLRALNGQTQKLSRLHFRKCHTDSVLRWLQGVDYPVLASTPDTELAFSSFCSQLGQTIKLNTPWMTQNSSPFPS